jgi:hypothetical protein
LVVHRVAPRVAPSETASVCAATATLSILNISPKQALTPEVSLKVSARVRVQ